MMFFAIVGMLTVAYMVIGFFVLLYSIGSGEIPLDEIKEDPFIPPIAIIAWPILVLEELGYL